MQTQPFFSGRLASQEVHLMLASAGWTESLTAKLLVSTSTIAITRVPAEAEPFTSVSTTTGTFGQTFGPDENAL